MKALKERILAEGENLGSGILKVDGFINHQVDPALMLEAGKELAAVFGIRSIPSFLFVPVGAQPQMAMGALPRETFVKAFKDVLGVEKIGDSSKKVNQA